MARGCRPGSGGDCRPPRGCCKGPKGRLTSLEAIVDDYIARVRPRKRASRAWYAGQPTLDEAVRVSANAIHRDDSMDPHQYRVGRENLRGFERSILGAKERIAACESFDELIELLEACGTTGIGDLTIYDTATRLGAYLERMPTEVFLHAGALAGARSLGLDTSRRRLDPRDLPPAFGGLDPDEIEDCLCIYKADIARVRSGGREPAAAR